MVDGTVWIPWAVDFLGTGVVRIDPSALPDNWASGRALALARRPCKRAGVRKYVLMGAQGSGKGTQAALLAQDLDLTPISVGDILRWHVQHHTKLGAQIRRVMAAGELVGDDLVETIVHERLDQHDWNFGFVVDGFPRNARQAEFFLESYDIDAVIHLDLPDSEVRRRVLARRLCANCGLDYNLTHTGLRSMVAATSVAAG